MTDRETIALYDTKAADYAALKLSPSQRRAMVTFTDGLPEGGHIFDLGCGPGLHGAAFLAQGFKVSGLDASAAFVATAKARGVAARLGSFDDVEEVAAYDGVWASFSLLHLPRAAFAPALARAIRALRPGGRLFLGMKVGDTDDRDALGRFYGFHTVAELHGHLEALGMTVIWEETGTEKGFAGTLDPVVQLVAAHA